MHRSSWYTADANTPTRKGIPRAFLRVFLGFMTLTATAGASLSPLYRVQGYDRVFTG